MKTFQDRVGKWMRACFTPTIIADKLERADRFLEESLELVQATGYSAERAHALVDYTFNRPVGEPFQEVGGVMVTLAALCNPHGLDMEDASETELARIWTKIDKIREKQATKPVGSALPVPATRTATPSPSVEGGDLVEQFARAMFDEWPLNAVSPALAEQSGQPIGTPLTWKKVLEMGGNHDGLLRLAKGAAKLHAALSAASQEGG